MSGSLSVWDGELVRQWLESRFEAARLDQAAADWRGYGAQDDYDKAAAEEWVCRTLKTAGRIDDQAAFSSQLKELLAQEEYRITGFYDCKSALKRDPGRFGRKHLCGLYILRV